MQRVRLGNTWVNLREVAPPEAPRASSWYAPPPSERFEVALVAVGAEAAEHASRLRQHGACRPDPDGSFAGARLVLLEPETAAATPIADASAAASRVRERVQAALLVVFIVSRDGPRDAALAARDALLADIPDARLLVIDLGAEPAPGSTARGERATHRRGLRMGPASMAGGRAGNERLDSAPAAVLYALFQPGFVAVDYPKYLRAVGPGPATAAVGFGRATGDAALRHALERAHAAWQGEAAARASCPDLLMLITGVPVDAPGRLRDSERIIDAFLAARMPDHLEQVLIAFPVLPPVATEVAIISKHQTVAG